VERPRVVFDEDLVLDADQNALARGIRVGSALAEAKSILRGDGALFQWEPEPYAKAAEIWLTIASEFSDVIEPVQQHTAYVDLSLHPNPVKVCQAMRKRLGRDVAIGLAPNRWLAREASAGRGQVVEQPVAFAAQLDTVRLPAEPEDIARLIQLGYRRIGNVAELLLETLQHQFGERAFAIYRAAHGGGNAEVAAKFPENSVAARFNFDGEADDLEVFDRGLHKAAQLLGDQLAEMDGAGKQIELFLEREDGTVEARQRTFAQPIDDIYKSLKLLIAVTPEQPPIGLRVRMPGIKKAKRIQLDLNGIKSKAEREQSLKGAMDRVCALFGSQAVIRADELQEPRWKAVRRMWENANGWTW